MWRLEGLSLCWLVFTACGSASAPLDSTGDSLGDGAVASEMRDGARPDAARPSERLDASTLDADTAAEDANSSAPLGCNGHVELCLRPFDRVVFAGTHNAHAARVYAYNALNTNQLSGLDRQLEDGVRCLLMDVYDQEGKSVLCHGSCALASTSHVAGLEILKAFLETHPREIVTIIYEDHLGANRIAADFANVGLDAFVYTHTQGTPWPTLGDMIAANTRLVVTAENGRPPPAFLHHVWDEAWDTPYQFRSAKDLSCDLNRGSRDNALFLINHWLSSGLGSIYLPSEDGAKSVNAFDVLYGRAKKCWDETGDVPNFIAVDFYEHGDLFKVVDALNGF